MKQLPTIWWIRRDFRLSDNDALRVALETGGPVIPVFINDAVVETTGAAPKWRLGRAVERFAQSLEAVGSQLVLRKGDPLRCLLDLARETGAMSVVWSRLCEPQSMARDSRVKSGLVDAGISARSCGGHLLFEPWTVETKTGGYYRVFTPFWKAVRNRDVSKSVVAPGKIPPPDVWPSSDQLELWGLDGAMNRGAEIVGRYAVVGEDAARDRLATFLDEKVIDYIAARDIPDRNGTSRLSENLAYGEISPRACWHAAFAKLQYGGAGAETFLKELVWREFAYHLAYHTPHITSGNWRPEWDAFPWNTDGDNSEVRNWKRGKTGVPLVDAAMRELYVTGTMHNRGRMIVASYLTKHLLSHWKIGQEWFADCLIDWDPASNAMGWQWSAGSGPDATPYFRVFNPETQLAKFDPKHAYVDRWIAEGRSRPSPDALAFFDAVPRSWGMTPDDPYPTPPRSLAEGRLRALSAYKGRGF